MQSILNALYECGYENDLQRFLSADEASNYRTACESRIHGMERLRERLNDEDKKKFDRFFDNEMEAARLDMECAFRYGLAIGLKLSGLSALLP